MSSVSIHCVWTAKPSVEKSGSSTTARANGSTVAIPVTWNSASARRARASAVSRSAAWTSSFPARESNAAWTVSPASTPPSHRTPGPEGTRSSSTRPALGRNPRPGSSALTRNSNAWPAARAS